MSNNNLINFRKSLNMTQKDMAKLLNISQPAYSDYETGKSTIPIEKLNIISNKYNVSIDYLTGISMNKNTKFIHKEINHKKIGERIRKLRTDNNLTLEYIAKKFNLGISTIDDYEKNKINIPVTILIEYSEFFNISIDWLCREK